MASWHLYNVQSKKHYKDLKIHELISEIFSNGAENWKYLAVWRAGDAEWLWMKDHPQLGKLTEEFKEDLTDELTDVGVLAPKIPNEILEAKTERRNFARIELPFSVIIVRGKEAVRAKIDNISLGGIKIKGKLPQKFKDSQCEIFIKCLDQGRYEFINCKGTAFEKEKSIDRLRFNEISEVMRSLLSMWIQNETSAPLIEPAA